MWLHHENFTAKVLPIVLLKELGFTKVYVYLYSPAKQSVQSGLNMSWRLNAFERFLEY